MGRRVGEKKEEEEGEGREGERERREQAGPAVRREQ